MVQSLQPTTDKPTIRPDLRPKGNLPDTSVVLAFMGQKAKLAKQKQEIADEIKKLNQQATNAGLVIQELDEAIKLRAMDPQTVIEKFARLKHYTMALEVPIGHQFSLFTQAPAEPSQESLLEQAYKEGRALGLLGEQPDYQKYHANTDMGMRHTEGWHDGQQQLGEIFVEANEKAKRAAEEKAKTKEQKAAEKQQAKDAKAQEKAQTKEKREAEKAAKAKAAAEEKAKKAAAKKEAADKKAAEKAAKPPKTEKVVPISRGKKPDSGARKH